MTKTLKEMQAELATLQAAIDARAAEEKVASREARKAMKKLQACKLTHKTSAKYFDLQAAYMRSINAQTPPLH